MKLNDSTTFYCFDQSIEISKYVIRHQFNKGVSSSTLHKLFTSELLHLPVSMGMDNDMEAEAIPITYYL
jgi:hypothetical protein